MTTVYEDAVIQIDILGQKYTVRLVPKSADERFENLKCNGLCDYSTHEIIMWNLTQEENNVGNLKTSIHHVLYHELVHAFMFESGLGSDWEHKDFGQEETTVDWIAWQAPKIVKAAEEIIEQFKERGDA
jgi:hypothetical protein